MQSRTRAHASKKRSLRRLFVVPVLLILVAVVALTHVRSDHKSAVVVVQSDPSITRVTTTALQVPSIWASAKVQTAPSVVSVTPPIKPAVTAASSTQCSQNTTTGQLVLVSIKARHMWACNGSSQLYDSAVVTGMQNLPADLTPIGTYHVSAKQTDLDLKGSDGTGSWNDHVSYWMPWLNNQYGNYGFHDATWRDPSAFGNIDPYTSDASHGCVELPLPTAKWLYNWAVVGTTVTIEA